MMSYPSQQVFIDMVWYTEISKPRKIYGPSVLILVCWFGSNRFGLYWKPQLYTLPQPHQYHFEVVRITVNLIHAISSLNFFGGYFPDCRIICPHHLPSNIKRYPSHFVWYCWSGVNFVTKLLSKSKVNHNRYDIKHRIHVLNRLRPGRLEFYFLLLVLHT